MEAKWLNIYDYGEGYVFGSDLYNNPIAATRDLADKEHYKHTINRKRLRLLESKC